MVARFQVALIALVAAFGLMFAVATSAKADDKKKDAKGCEVCATVKDVCKATTHCAGCAKPNEKCEHCDKAAGAEVGKYVCKDCKADKACDHCKKLLEDAKGDKVVAAKKLMESKTFCCKGCEKAGEEKAAKCQKCLDARKKIEDAEVKK
jgi:hypothetical protein